jgi:hypothetical protein
MYLCSMQLDSVKATKWIVQTKLSQWTYFVSVAWILYLNRMELDINRESDAKTYSWGLTVMMKKSLKRKQGDLTNEVSNSNV